MKFEALQRELNSCINIMRNFKELSIWQRSHALTLKIYHLTKEFPKEKLFGLNSQIRRSAYSIPTNIAEGSGRDSSPEMKRFPVISRGSATELEYQIILAHDLGYISEVIFHELGTEINEIQKMIYTFIKNMKCTFPCYKK
jgi:four helix bundle protein